MHHFLLLSCRKWWLIILLNHIVHLAPTRKTFAHHFLPGPSLSWDEVQQRSVFTCTYIPSCPAVAQAWPFLSPNSWSEGKPPCSLRCELRAVVQTQWITEGPGSPAHVHLRPLSLLVPIPDAPLLSHSGVLNLLLGGSVRAQLRMGSWMTQSLDVPCAVVASPLGPCSMSELYNEE